MGQWGGVFERVGGWGVGWYLDAHYEIRIIGIIIITAKVQYSVWFKIIGSSRLSSICMEIVNLLLIKCRQGLSNCIEKSPVLCLCKFLCLVDLSICVCLNRNKPSVELSIKFNQYNLRSFQKALVWFNNLWIDLVFKEFNWVSMFKIPIPPFQVESLTRCLVGLNFCSSRENFYLKEGVNDEVYFWDSEKFQNFLQVDTTILGVRIQTCPKYPK